MLDVSEHLEDCVTGAFRACTAIRRTSDENKAFASFLDENQESISRLREIRNQFEHMHGQIVSGETGGGPISIALSDQGRYLRFRKLKFEVASLFKLLKGLFYAVATMYPGFDKDTPAQTFSTLKLEVTADFQVEKKNKT